MTEDSDDKPRKTWPLTVFTRAYLGAGILVVAAYWAFIDTEIARSLGLIWLLVGSALAMIVFGRARRDDSPEANLFYLLGIAWLAVLLGVGIFRLL